MPKSQKQTGYLVKCEWFVKADLSDTDLLSKVQKCKAAAAGAFDTVGAEVDLIHSTLDVTRR